jgi:hypothetical protein
MIGIRIGVVPRMEASGGNDQHVNSLASGEACGDIFHLLHLAKSSGRALVRCPGNFMRCCRAVSEMAGVHMATADEGDSRLW